MTETYEVAVWIEDGAEDATGFTYNNADGLNDMGYVAVYFEVSGRSALLRRVDDE